MNNMIADNFTNIFARNRKCIINTDLDGILSGMILQKFLGWQIVGFSNCSGAPEDELWLEDNNVDINACVFVDLPVCINNIDTIDQHFVAADNEILNRLKDQDNKVNPNLMRNKVYVDASNQRHYTEKYPFGTVHFIIAILENMGIIPADFVIDFNKQLGSISESFQLADLILRADRVIGNTYSYTPNCLNWADWLMGIGGNNTRFLFTKVKQEYNSRINNQSYVERYLTFNFKCKKDGECSDLFRMNKFDEVRNLFNYLGECINMEPIHLFSVVEFGKLRGYRMSITNYNFNIIKNVIKKDDVFSYAFVSMKELSVTCLEED